MSDPDLDSPDLYAETDPVPDDRPTPVRRFAARWEAVAMRLVAVVIALGLLAGCASAVGDQRRSSEATPTQGGTMRVGVKSDLVPASIFTNTSESANTVIGLAYDTLIDYPTDATTPKPSLATGWKVSPDGKTVRLTLRKDVRFHNGRRFTSADAAFSLKTWADPKWSAQLGRTAALITSFDTSRPDVLTFRLSQPASNLFDLLDVVPIIDRKSVDKIATGEAYVGTGAFEFTGWEPNNQLTFRRNDDYWDGSPRLDGVQVKVIPDSRAHVTALRSGQLDLLLEASNRDAENLAADGRFTLDKRPGAENQLYVGASLTNKDLTDPLLRRAISAAVDRDRIVSEVFRGFGEAAVLPWPRSSVAYDVGLGKGPADGLTTDPDRDLDRARKLLAAHEKKIGDTPVLPLAFASDRPEMEVTAQIVQANLAEIGIETDLRPTEFSTYMQQLINGKFEGLWINTHTYAQYTPATLATSAFPFNAEKNASHYDSPSYKRHSEQAWAVVSPTDPKARRAIAGLNRDLLRDAFLIEIMILPTQRVAANNVHGVGLSKRNEIDLSDAYLGE